MPQFRLTQKAAMDCKILKLLEPVDRSHALDDWFVDRILHNRKKIAMFTHAKTKFTFFIPYAEAGGAKALFSYFKIQLNEFFKTHSLLTLITEVNELFLQEVIFTKTVDKKVLGHMNDFKRSVHPYYLDDDVVNWYEKSENVNISYMNVFDKTAATPLQLFNKLLDVNLPDKKFFYEI